MQTFLTVKDHRMNLSESDSNCDRDYRMALPVRSIILHLSNNTWFFEDL